MSVLAPFEGFVNDSIDYLVINDFCVLSGIAMNKASI